MKKIAYLTVFLCLIALLFSGCGGDKGEKDTSSVVSGTPATVSPSPTPAPQKAKALRVTADSGLNVRAEASTDSEILGLTENGDRLALMLEDEQNGWYQVRYQGKTGYVSADYVEVIEVTLEEYNQLSGNSESSESSGSSTSSEDSSSSSGSSSSGESCGETSSSTSSADEEDGE